MEESTTVLLLPRNNYRGSQKTYEMVRRQILERFGAEAAENYDPTRSARTLKEWLSLNYKVRKGEKGLKSLIFVDVKNTKGEVIGRRAKLIWLFHTNSVEPINKTN